MNRRWLLVAGLLLLCGMAFWWRLGYLGLIDPDEPFYAQSAREMLAAHDAATPRIFGQPQFEKPILVYWLTMASLRVFGENEFAVRAPAALFATLLVFLTWLFGGRLYNERAGLLAAVVLATSVEFFVSARMILTDMMFATFVCGSAFSLWLASRSERRSGRWFVLACASSGFAVLAKGPLGFLLPALAGSVILLGRGSPRSVRPLPLVSGAATFAVIAVPWYAVMVQRFGQDYFNAFFIHENVERFFRAEHRNNNHAYYYLAVLVGGCVPWAPALGALAGWARRSKTWSDASRFLGLWGLLCLAFFTAAQSKLPTYILFLFVPLALLLGRALDLLLKEDVRGPVDRWVMGGLGTVQVALFALAPRLVGSSALAWPLLAVAACLAVALVLQLRRIGIAWIAATSAASLILLSTCLGGAGASVDAIVSARALGLEIARDSPPSDTLLVSPLLARGIFYYSHHPVAVLSDRARPFYTLHPLPIVKGSGGVNRLLEGGHTALCVASTHDWTRLDAGLATHTEAILDTVGGKILARVSPPAASPTPERIAP